MEEWSPPKHVVLRHTARAIHFTLVTRPTKIANNEEEEKKKKKPTFRKSAKFEIHKLASGHFQPVLANNLGWVTRQLRHPRWGFLDENDIREVLSRIWTHRAELHPPPLEPWSLSKVLNNVRLLQRFSFGAAFCSSRSSDAMLVRSQILLIIQKSL